MKINKNEFRKLVREAMMQFVAEKEKTDNEKEKPEPKVAKPPTKPESKPALKSAKPPEPKAEPKEKPKQPLGDKKPSQPEPKQAKPEPKKPETMPNEEQPEDKMAIFGDRLTGQHISGAKAQVLPNGLVLSFDLVGSKLPAIIKYTNDGRLMLSFKGQIYVLSQ